MRKIIFIILIGINLNINAQNTFPSSGNVGIGTQTPSEMLDVRGTIRSYNYDLNTGIQIGASATERPFVGFHVSDNSQRFKFELNGINSDSERIGLWSTNRGYWTPARETISFMANGNVGIDVSSPLAKLHVNGRMMLNHGVIQQGGTPITNTTDLGLYSHLAGHWIRIVSNNAPIRFFTDIGNIGAGSNIKMSIEANGSVGIGTTSTGSHKLAVEGSIGAREIKVEANGWSDFVFENDYELRSLEETEKFIIENKHLPGIPSEKEVDKEGINLGEMDAKLLQKIEELTLYLIEQNKLNQTLQEKVNQLEEEMVNLKKK